MDGTHSHVNGNRMDGTHSHVNGNRMDGTHSHVNGNRMDGTQFGTANYKLFSLGSRVFLDVRIEICIYA